MDAIGCINTTANKEIVTKGLQTFYEVGTALAEIRDSKSYKLVDGYDTFEKFCRAEWDMGRSNAYQLMDDASVVQNVRNFGQNLPDPTTQSHAHPLLKIEDPEVQGEAWKRVLEVASGENKKVTAKLVKSVVDAILDGDEFTAPDPPVL